MSLKTLMLRTTKLTHPLPLRHRPSLRLSSARFSSSQIPTSIEAKTVKSNPKEENLRLRQNLALSYRLLDDLSLNEGSCNHLSVMAPSSKGIGHPDVMLIAPGYMKEGGGIDWSQVTASCLLGLNPVGQVMEGEGEPELSGACIHLGVRRARPEAKVIMHTHTPYATALGCLEDPSLMMVHQNSCRFLDRCAWDTGYQPATMIEEGERLGKELGDKSVLFMCHHGTLVVADSIHVAFDEVYYLERACMVQLLAMGAAGKEALKLMPKDVQEATKQTAVEGDTLDKYAAKHFYAKWNMYKARNSDVFQ